MSRRSETEQELRRAAEAGEVLDLRRRGDNTLRAEAIRDLLRADDVDPQGVQVRGARITGQLDLDNLRTSTPLDLDDCVFEHRFSVRDAELPALGLDGCTLPALDAVGLRTHYLGMWAARCTEKINLDDARIDGTLSLCFCGAGSLSGTGLHVRRNVQARGLYSGKVELDSCDIGGDLDLSVAVIASKWHTALAANRAKIGGVIIAGDAIFRGRHDAFSLLDATAGGLVMTGAVLRSEEGNALCTDGTHVRSEVKLNDVNVVSQRAESAIRMVDTKIGAGLLISGLVRNRGGQAVSLHKTMVEASLTIHEAEIDADCDEAALEISNCDIGSELTIRLERLVNRGDGRRLDLFTTKVGRALALEADVDSVTLNGLTYPNAPEDTDAWLAMLRDHTSRYEAQPYQQLAALHRAAGHEHTARKVLIAQQRDLRRRGDPGNKLWHWFLGVTLGYGYKPSRAVAGLLATFVLALCLVWTTNAYNGLTPAKDRGPDACSPVNRISLAADLAIPLVKLGGTPRCELANGPAGQWATGAGWLVQILGWSFATLSVAGFTGLVRKS